MADTYHVGSNIRSITKYDIEFLRLWKNNNIKFFFHSTRISQNDQENWYESYLLRDEDFMFIVQSYDKRIGCIGIRCLAEKAEWDVYNVILGDSDFKGSGIMSIALAETIDLAIGMKNLPVTLRVLKTNVAISWYKRNKFVEVGEDDLSIKMRYSE
jgi:ribosomal protein S18 acetylase RimI-like enzyme